MWSTMSTVKRMAPVPALGAALCAALLMPARAEACSCMAPPPPAEARDHAAAVFEGRVLAVPAPGQPTESLVIRLRIVRAWKGVTTEEVSVTTASNSAACGFEFAADQSYLVYAHANEDGTLGVASVPHRPHRRCTDVAALGTGPDHLARPGERCRPAPRLDPPHPAAGGTSCTIATARRRPLPRCRAMVASLWLADRAAHPAAFARAGPRGSSTVHPAPPGVPSEPVGLQGTSSRSQCG
jgi:hypothetical protein